MSAARTSHRILVIEDDPNLSGILEHRLRQDGYEVLRVSTGFDAGIEAHRFRPHLIFLDLMLPGMDGAEVCRQLRADPGLRAIRVIGMSASSDDAALARFRELVDDFMPKPFKLAEIRPRVEKLIGPIATDPESLEGNRVVVLTTDPEWGREAHRVLSAAGYRVEICASPEAAGFAVARLRPDAIAAHGVDETVRRKLRSSAPVVDGAPEGLPAAVAAAAGAPRPRRSGSFPFLPAAVAVVGIAAAVVAAVLWPRSQSRAPDPEIEEWRNREALAAEQRLVYFRGSYWSRTALGEGCRVRLRDRSVEGFLSETRDGFLLRAADGTLTIRRDDLLERERLRLPYEEYWDRDAALDGRNAQAHHDLGLWCRERGIPEAALREFRHALLADPDHEASRRALGYTRRDGRWAR